MGKVNVRKRSNGWEYYFETAHISGKRNRRSKGGFRTKSDALAAGTAAKAQYDNTGVSFHPSESSVSDFFDYWLENYVRQEFAETTEKGYEKKIRLYIKPTIGDYKLKNISPAVLKELLYDLHRRQLSRNTLVSIKGILTSAFDYAANTVHFISKDPAYRLSLPNRRADERVGTTKKERVVVSPDIWHMIMERFPEGSTVHLPLMLAYHCGLRLGECFALTWDCIDLDQRAIYINKQVQIAESGWMFRPPKYDSVRKIDIGNSVAGLLKRIKQQQEKDREYCGEYYHKNQMNYNEVSQTIAPDDQPLPVHLVNIRQDGTWCTPRIMQHAGRVIHGKNKKGAVPIMEQWDYHSLRHTHATLLLEKGVPMPLIQQRLGHADIKITEKYTNHVTDNMVEYLKALLD